MGKNCRLSKLTYTCDLKEQTQEAALNIAHAKKEHERELQHVQKKIKELNELIDEADDDNLEDLEAERTLLGRQRRAHTQALKALTEKKQLIVGYNEVKSGLSVLLPSGKYVRPSFLPHPVVWVPDGALVEEKVHEVVHKEKKIPLPLSSSDSARKAEAARKAESARKAEAATK